MEDSEFDIYDDLDVFENNEKQKEKSADYLELHKKFREAEEEIRRLQEENESLKEQIATHQKIEGRLERNGSSLLVTAKAEIKRKDDEIHHLRKEKDNIIFRRKHNMQRNLQTRSSATQSQITCKPFIPYELVEIDLDARDKSMERSHRRNDNQRSNPFASKSNNDNCNENKVNPKSREICVDKNHRQQFRDDYSTRGKHSNQRSRNDERREQLNVERPKRRRSRSLSKERKRARRSRSRSRSRSHAERRLRRRNERNSPDKGTRNQHLRTKREKSKSQSPKRSTSPHENDEKRQCKQKLDENATKQNSSRQKSDVESQPKENEMPTKCVISDEKVKSVKTEIEITPPVYSTLSHDALEEGEIEEDHDSKGDTTDCIVLEQNPSLQFTSDIDAASHEIKTELTAAQSGMSESEKLSENKSISSTDLNSESQMETMLEENIKNDDPPQSSHEIDTNSATVKTESIDVVKNTKVEIEPIRKTEDIEMKGLDNTEPKRIENPLVHENDLIDKTPPNQERNDENSVPNLQDIRIEGVKNVTNCDEALAVNNENTATLNSPPSKNITKLNEHDENTKQSETNSNGQSFTDAMYHELLNTSGNKSVKNISTSSKDYLIVENENNETDIYVTRKKKKKKKKSLTKA
ncbi:arginine/serine-rich coiled-coil protein 2 [Contarinia nasturtii]|uniref:arginine/serine-rich coiled-coil protein 2 n=1 Tax=Contarinia nasturtii TaxID=265458 RepID=UPI0012D396C3|nr:arginine/serine-rich coiled-coil protein 2 [Contarinia nasturtii]